MMMALAYKLAPQRTRAKHAPSALVAVTRGVQDLTTALVIR